MFGTGGRGATAGIARHRAAGAGGDRGGEDRQFLDQFLGAALRTGSLAFPAGRADEQLEIFRARAAVKFVEGHGVILPDFYGLSSASCRALPVLRVAEVCRTAWMLMSWGTWKPTIDAK